MASKNDRGKRSSSKPRRRREEQLDLFPQDLKLAAIAPLGAARRSVSRNDARPLRAAAPIPLVLL